MQDTAVVTWLTDPEASDPARSGGKGANLAAMARAGLPVPDGFVVSTAAYRDNAGEHGLDALVHREMTGLDDDPDAVEAASARLRQQFEAVPVPERLREQITSAYRALGEPPVAVRSSATAEDLPEASFAGQQDTVLDVTGPAALCDAVRRCWSSLWTPRAIAYRHHHGIGHEHLAVAVVVQRMVSAESAGVLFTADPVTGRRGHVVVEASAGLGDAVVGGRVTPDRWLIDAGTRRTLSGPGGTGGILGAADLDALVDLGLRAAALAGSPQDVEWATADGRCWLLQSRPITSLFPLPVPPPTQPQLRVYIPATLVSQGFAEPMTAAGNAFLRGLATGWIQFFTTGSRMRGDEAPPPWLPIVAERLFVDITPLLQRPRLAARVLAGLGAKDPGAGTALREWLDTNRGRLSRPGHRAPVRALMASVPAVLGRIVGSTAAPARSRRRLSARTTEELARLEQESAALSTPVQQVDFVDRVLPARTTELVTAQLAPVYAEQLTLLAAQWLVRRWLGSSSTLEPVRRWLPHDPTVAMSVELARLARGYRNAPGSRPAASDPGVREFLRRYGHRAPDREIDLGLPRLDEDPTYVVELIRSYQHAPDGGDPLARFEAGQADARATATALVTRTRQVKGRLRAAVLRVLLDRHRALGGLREQPKFDMVRAIALGRRTLLRAGTALAADDLLDTADDVFFLDTRQLHAALSGAPSDLRALAAANRRAYERELHRRAVQRILVSDGETLYQPASREGAADLVATPVSPGVHEGVVRVLDSPVGSGLQPGEVLVAATTDPGWTPLFPIAGALVMDVGGVVSHGAVVAREYGIPAVAGIAGATTRLRTGQRVRVDGGNGTVTVLEPAGVALVDATSEHVDPDVLDGVV